ncbi:MAG: hypothetical protein QOF78_1300 [Phycisphaerales bacterium]|jgi:hypothetical protein|nr:hypothetical protein [Phycisphaerales bacterium]
MKTITFLITVVISVASVSAWTMQETRPAASAPVAAANGTEKLIATVTGVEGIVQVRESEDAPWQRATVNMQVGENAEFRTGPRSAVRFVIPPDHTITLDRLGSVKVLQAINDNGVIKTQMGMRYGRTRYDIEAGGREHESSIASPSSTLAVRGTRFSSYDQRPFPAQAVSLTGRVQFRDLRKRVTIGSRGGGKTKIDVNNPNAASLALGQSVVDPGARLARTAAEDQLVATLLQSGATVSFDYDKGIRVVRGGQPPLTDAELIPTLPGTLNFVLRWTQPGTDLNLGVFTFGDQLPQGQTLYPVGGVNTSSSGGEIPFDHRGGPHGGIEVGFWPANFPRQAYRAGSVHISGPNSPATLDIFLNGQRVTFTGPDGQPTQTASYLAGPINPIFGSGQAVGSVIVPADPAAKSLRPTAAATKPPMTPVAAKAKRR